MQGVIDVDVLVLVNAVIGYFVLRCTAFLAGREQRPWRFCAASVLAGLSALTLLWPFLPWPLAFFVKILCASGIIVTSFRFVNIHVFLKTTLWYIVLNLLLGGVVALAVFCGAKNLRYENFSLYLHVSPVLLIACILLMYVLIQGATYFFGRSKPQQRASFCAELQGEKLHGIALLDTGMHLLDAMTGEQAALCSLPALQMQIPRGTCSALRTYFESGTLAAPMWLVAVKTATGLRMLPALRCAALTVNGRTRHQPVLVFTPETLLDGGCELLIHPDFLQER
ncbi:MAG: sigma-E processing peptidase SpoIIGA [Ruthenibacterium sp.]